MNCKFQSLPDDTSHLSVGEALTIAAKAATEQNLEGVRVRCKNPAGGPSINKSIVNLNVFKGLRSNNQKIHAAVPKFPNVFILK